MTHNIVSFLDLLNVQWRILVKKKKPQQFMSYWLENKCINNVSVAAKSLLLTFWCTSFIILCKKNDRLANSRFRTKLKLIINWANYAYLKINELSSPLTEMNFVDINHMANKIQNKYQWWKNIGINFYSQMWNMKKDDFTVYVFYIVLGLSYAIEVKPDIWDTCVLFCFVLFTGTVVI